MTNEKSVQTNFFGEEVPGHRRSGKQDYSKTALFARAYSGKKIK